MIRTYFKFWFYLIIINEALYFQKLAVMVQSIAWNMDSNILAGIQDTALTVWYYPAVVFVDNRLLRRSISVKDTR